MQADRDARIRERAYQIWVAEGRPDGNHDDHWHRAEREIAAAEAAASAAPAGREAGGARRGASSAGGAQRLPARRRRPPADEP